MHATRARDVILYAVGAGLIGWLIIRSNYGAFPNLGWFVPISLPVLAVFEALTGAQLRARIHHRGGARPIEPLTAARTVALAKASVIVGAVMTGLWAALLIYVLPKRGDLASAAGDTKVGVAGLIGSLLLLAAAVWLEYCCRTPDPPDDQRNREPDRDESQR